MKKYIKYKSKYINLCIHQLIGGKGSKSKILKGGRYNIILYFVNIDEVNFIKMINSKEFKEALYYLSINKRNIIQQDDLLDKHLDLSLYSEYTGYIYFQGESYVNYDGSQDTQEIGYDNFTVALTNLQILLNIYNKEEKSKSYFVIKPVDIDFKKLPLSRLNLYTFQAKNEDRLLNYLPVFQFDHKTEAEAEVRTKFTKFFEECPIEELVSLQAQQKIELDNLKFDNILCRKCWLINNDCICNQAIPITQSQFPHRLIIYMHFKEYARSSNTGALPQVCMGPSNVKILVKGIPKDDFLFEQICFEPNTFIFFPSTHSTTFPEFIEIISKTHNFGKSLSIPTDLRIPKFNIIIVDGTWTQAKKIERTLDTRIPRVQLMSIDDLSLELRAPLREHLGPDHTRICTLGAIIKLLQEMNCNQSVIQSLSELLILKTHAIRKWEFNIEKKDDE
jgi:DTW domain-containing protein YfiP